MKRSIFEMIILITISIFAGLIVNAFSSNGIPLFGNWNPNLGSVNAGGPCKPSTIEITEDQITSLYLSLSTLFVDARTPDDYEEGHIPGAISFPVGAFNERIPQFLEEYPRDRQIIVYCSGIDCHDSHDLASLLKEQGYHDVLVYTRGFSGWIAEQRSVQIGPTP